MKPELPRPGSIIFRQVMGIFCIVLSILITLSGLAYFIERNITFYAGTDPEFKKANILGMAITMILLPLLLSSVIFIWGRKLMKLPKPNNSACSVESEPSITRPASISFRQAIGILIFAGSCFMGFSIIFSFVVIFIRMLFGNITADATEGSILYLVGKFILFLIITAGCLLMSLYLVKDPKGMYLGLKGKKKV